MNLTNQVIWYFIHDQSDCYYCQDMFEKNISIQEVGVTFNLNLLMTTVVNSILERILANILVSGYIISDTGRSQ